MGNVSVGRYPKDSGIGYQGWIEPEDRSWIMFIKDDGTPQVFLDRDPETGAVQ